MSSDRKKRGPGPKRPVAAASDTSSGEREQRRHERRASATTEVPSERLQKVLAQAGIASRRDLESWIVQGRISVNGETAVLGQKVSPKDHVLVDGKPISLVDTVNPARRVIIYNKPEGEVTTRRDPEGRPTVFRRLPPLKGQRWIAVGRLDVNTTGLLIFTTDGELANRLMHPSYEMDREYAVRIFGVVDETMVERLREGVLLEDGMARFSDVAEAGGSGMNRWFHVTLMEGRSREVRRLWESQGVKVSRLKRVRFGPVMLNSRLRMGMWEELDTATVDKLSRAVSLDPVPSTKPERRGKSSNRSAAPRKGHSRGKRS